MWDALKINAPLRKTDCIIAMGSHDLRVAEYAAQLLLDEWAPVMVCSGGLGRLTKGIWREAEGRKFAQIAIRAGVPEERVLIEDQSTNTAENLIFSRELLLEQGLDISSATLVHKPYMERRAIATAGIAWPDIETIAASPPITFLDYPTEEITLDEVIHIMVGDFKRLIVYAERGFQTQQAISKDAIASFECLVKAGYDRHLIAKYPMDNHR